MKSSLILEPQQDEQRDEGEGRQLVARQSGPQHRLGANELGEEPIGQVRDDVELDELAAQESPLLEPVQDKRSGQMKSELVKLGWMPQFSVAEIDAPGKPRDR